MTTPSKSPKTKSSGSIQTPPTSMVQRKSTSLLGVHKMGAAKGRRDELESRFGLTFVVLDREYVLKCRRERGYGVNPWSTHTRFVISHSLLRDESYAGPLRNWLDVYPSGSLLILDEAHNAAPASGGPRPGTCC